MPRRLPGLPLLLALLGASGAGAQGFTTRTASLGILDVPVSETVGVGQGKLGLDLFAEHSGAGWRAAPLPLSIVAGLGPSLDLGFSLREGGVPRDERTGMPTLAVSAKWNAWMARGRLPGLAVAATFDRLNLTATPSLRAISSTDYLGPVRFSLALGAEVPRYDVMQLAPVGGFAVAARHRGTRLEGLLDVTREGSAWTWGAGVRWPVLPSVALGLSTQWIPHEAQVRVAFGLTLSTGQTPTGAALEVATGPAAVQGPTGPTQRVYSSPKPKFRLRIHQANRIDAPRVHEQFEPDHDDPCFDGGPECAEQAPATPAATPPKETP